MLTSQDLFAILEEKIYSFSDLDRLVVKRIVLRAIHPESRDFFISQYNRDCVFDIRKDSLEKQLCFYALFVVLYFKLTRQWNFVIA